MIKWYKRVFVLKRLISHVNREIPRMQVTVEDLGNGKFNIHFHAICKSSELSFKPLVGTITTDKTYNAVISCILP